ncbi:MAG: hypothetical protein WC522_03915 [Candidatus Omnitrophota bacterium]
MKDSLKFHPLVEKTKKGIDKSHIYRGCIKNKHGDINIRIGPNSLDRALKIMDSVIKKLEKKSAKVFLNEQQYKSATCVTIFEETLSIDLYEKINITKKKEMRDRFDYDPYNYTPNGNLVLRIKDGPYEIRSEWEDGKRKQLEDHIDDFIDGLFLAAKKGRADRLEREREHRKWEAEESRKEKEEQARQREQAELDSLENEAMRWQRSKIIRAYIEATTDAYIKKNGKIDPGSEFDQWKTWANERVNRLDPLYGKFPA